VSLCHSEVRLQRSNLSFAGRIQRRLQQFLLIREIRIAVGLLRYVVFRHLIRSNRVYEASDQSHLGKDTFSHNYRQILHSLLTHDRVHHLLHPVVAIEEVATNLPTLKTLSIGPRSEGELLLIAGYGFSWPNIRAVDLFSYSPRIDVADMHDLPYADNSFDIIFNGWCLAYSDDQETALKEMVRVLRPGGFIALGQGYDNRDEEQRRDLGYVGGKNRKNTIEAVFEPISQHVGKIYFRHDIDAAMAAKGQRAMIAVISIQK